MFLRQMLRVRWRYENPKALIRTAPLVRVVCALFRIACCRLPPFSLLRRITLRFFTPPPFHAAIITPPLHHADTMPALSLAPLISTPFMPFIVDKATPMPAFAFADTLPWLLMLLRRCHDAAAAAAPMLSLSRFDAAADAAMPLLPPLIRCLSIYAAFAVLPCHFDFHMLFIHYAGAAADVSPLITLAFAIAMLLPLILLAFSPIWHYAITLRRSLLARRHFTAASRFAIDVSLRYARRRLSSSIALAAILLILMLLIIDTPGRLYFARDFSRHYTLMFTLRDVTPLRYGAAA